jgi:hypothetical protein
MSTFKLIKTETGRKAAKFNYKIVDENGAVLTERNSNRDYVAATINGYFYFGRPDLVGKGDHGRFLKSDHLKNDNPDFFNKISKIAYL